MNEQKASVNIVARDSMEGTLTTITILSPRPLGGREIWRIAECCASNATVPSQQVLISLGSPSQSE